MAKKINATPISVAVCAAIKAGTWTEMGFTLPPLDRALYQAVAKVLTNFGGTWHRKLQVTTFVDEDAVVSVQEAAETGMYVDLKKVYQYFPTPRPVAEKMLAELCLSGTLRMLEPSAGEGHLIQAIAAAHTDHSLDAAVTAFELNPKMVERLQDMTGSDSQVLKHVHAGDFLEKDPADYELFDRVMMNPPFTASQDMAHVQHAYKFLAAGGRLVAILSPGFMFRGDKKAKAFRAWLAVCDAQWQYLPDGSFKAAGTNVRTVLMTIDKPEAA